MFSSRVSPTSARTMWCAMANNLCRCCRCCEYQYLCAHVRSLGMRARKRRFSAAPQVLLCRTHLGHILNPGDHCLGYEQGLGSPRPHLRRDRAHPGHICAGTALTPATSAPGLGSPRPHLRRDWAHPGHICAGTGLTLATFLTPATTASGKRRSIATQRRRSVVAARAPVVPTPHPVSTREYP